MIVDSDVGWDELHGGARVRRIWLVVAVFVVAVLAAAIPVRAQKQLAKSPEMMAAKTVYFEDRTGSDAVAAATVAELKKWGAFRW